MKIMRFSRQYLSKSLFILLVFGFVHHVGSLCTVANLGNIFSWLLWLFIAFYLMLSAGEFVRCLVMSCLSQNMAFNFKLLK